jgi:hypothetical protein
MRAKLEDLPITIEAPEAVVREIEWGDLHVGVETFHETFDLTPLLKGLPDDRCQCPHWGYMISGRMRVRYADREEVIEAGDVYYLPPGHVPTIEPGSRLVEFSPKGAYQQTMEVAARNFAALTAEAPTTT